MIPLLLLLAQPPAPRFATYPVELRVTPTTTGARLRLSVQDPRTHAIVRRFSIVHERPMHLFVVGSDLQFFVREQPLPQPDGVFMVDVPLPKAGPYMAIAEFLPERGTPQLFQQMFTTGEAFATVPAPPLDLAAKTSDGVRVGIDVSSVRSGEAAPIGFRLDDQGTGAPLTDLEPYLGTPAHVLVVSTDLTETIDAQEDGSFRGPGLRFLARLPRAGRYKAWIQFQRAGRVTTAAFVFEVR